MTNIENKLLTFIKFFTYITASVIMLMDKGNTEALVPLFAIVSVILANAYSRDYLHTKETLLKYGMINLVVWDII